MNISVARMKPTASALRGIEKQLKRLADYFEAYLAYAHNVHVETHKPDTSGDEPEILYTDEEKDFIREYEERMGKKVKWAEEE